MRLAAFLGCLHPDYLLPQLTLSQLEDWQEFYDRVGFGPDRNDVSFALVCQSMTGHKHLTDFMPWYEPDATVRTDEEIMNAYKASLAARKQIRTQPLDKKAIRNRK
ncbi:MAG: hypothetical protein HY253_12905 [Burkholderiales bacterium]|nr:hypothetical protein [Burkholderiales bacterium]